MAFSRRNFLSSIGFITAGSSILPKKVIQNNPFIGIEPTEFWDKVRKEFPLTKNRIYLNNGTFGPSPQFVLDRLNKSFNHLNSEGEYGSTKTTFEAVARIMNAETEEIALSHNTTEGINYIAQGLKLNVGDEVILTDHEHVGNAMPWLNRAARDHIKLKVFSPGLTKEENFDKIKSLIGPKTRVIAIPHITCTTGLVFPIKEIAELAKSKNILTAVDGAHGLGTFNLDMKDLGVDFYVTCGHKWLLAPGGTGAVYIKKDKLDLVDPIYAGAYSDKSWTLTKSVQEFTGYSDKAHRFFYGTQSKGQFDGMTAAIEFHESIDLEKIESRIKELNQLLFEGLKELEPKIEIISAHEKDSRICMLSFVPKTMDYKELGKLLTEKKFRVRLVPESGLNAVRISTHIYNSKEEVLHFLNTLEEIV